MTEGAAASNKRKAQWTPQTNRKRHMASTAKGSSALLVTCDKIKERQVVKDILNILNDVAEVLYPGTKEDAAEKSESKAKTSAELLQDEIAGLKKDAKEGSTGRFAALDSGVKGIILVQFLDESLDVKRIVDHIFQQVVDTKEFASRFIQRMIPLEKLCYPSVEDIAACAKPFIERHFKDTEGIQYAVEVRKRNSGNIASMDIINACVAVVGPNHKVNLTKPDVVIVIEIFKNVCGVSVVTDFHRFKKFNVRLILDPPKAKEETKEKAKKDANEATNDEAKEEEAKEDAKEEEDA
ncbi:THUMP domain-containing protein 1 [Aphanomyces cochlioides]|nr:THUMP domain-containing protein 1 [Aphanomyces cochlioides]